MLSTNVNFPENLSISPSEYPDHEINTLNGVRKEHSVFGDIAQREAIEKYGIAGRICDLVSSSHTAPSPVYVKNQIYFPELLAPLLRTLLQATSPPFCSSTTNAAVKVVIAYKLRSLSKETPFWSAFGLWFNFEPVLVKNVSSVNGQWQRFGSSSDDLVFIFVGHRRPESFSWTIPSDDSDLLGGKGAMGNDSVKGDDTFETLLFMTMDDMNT
ncbi:hypothetical protein C0993_000143 [Termitomyces sp. T159_Od127]|nr:hypothetical protein C0993_000143 [Termitomyces sp. T159_Od127]